MEWAAIWPPLIAALVGALSGWAGALKTAAPRLIDQRIKERETKILEEAEERAYVRNRQATREDKALEMLHDTLEWLKDQAEKDHVEAAAQRDQMETLIKAIQEMGFQVSRTKENVLALSHGYAGIVDTLRLTSRQLQEISHYVEQGKGNRGAGND